MITLFFIFAISSLLWLLVCAVKSPRRGIIAGIVVLTLTPNAIPWDLFSAGRTETFADSAARLGFFVAAICYGAMRKNLNISLRYLLNRYILALLALWLVLSAYLLISENPSYGLSKTLEFAAYCILPLVALAMLAPFDQIDLRFIFHVIVLGSSCVTLNLVAFGDLSAERVIVDDKEHPSWLARQIGVGVVCLLISALSVTKRGIIRPVLSVGVAIPLLYALTLTGSRGPLLGIGFAILGVLLLTSLDVKRRLQIAWRLGIMCLILFIVAFYSPIELPHYASFERVDLFISTIGVNESDVGRIQRFETAIDGFAGSYGVGIGTGSFATLYGVTGREYPHNVLLEAMAEQGVVGLLAVAALLSMTLVKFVKLNRVPNLHSGWLMGAWLFGVLNALVAGDMPANDLLWITGGFAWLISRRVSGGWTKVIQEPNIQETNLQKASVQG
jgi:O-antigen ligase